MDGRIDRVPARRRDRRRSDPDDRRPGLVGGRRQPRPRRRPVAALGGRSSCGATSPWRATARWPPTRRCSRRRCVASSTPSVAAGLDTVEASLELARSRQAIDDAPPVFGTIHARPLLAALDRSDAARAAAATARRTPGSQDLAELIELPDDDDGEDMGHLLSSPVGGGGAVGRLLRRLLSPARQRGGGGPPGADAPTHMARGRPGAGRRAAVSSPTPATRSTASPTLRAAGSRLPRVGRAPAAVPARLVHGGGGRPAVGGRRRRDPARRPRAAPRAGSPRHRPDPVPAPATGRRHRHRRRRGGAGRHPGRVAARRRLLRREPSAPARPRRPRAARRLRVGRRAGHRRQDRARAPAVGGGRAHRRPPRPRRSGRPLRLQLPRPAGGAAAAGQGVRRPPRRRRGPAAGRPGPGRLHAPRCRHPPRRPRSSRSAAGRPGGCWSCSPTASPTTTATRVATARPTPGGPSSRPAVAGWGASASASGPTPSPRPCGGCSAPRPTPPCHGPEQLPGLIGPLFRAALRSAEAQRRAFQRKERTRERLEVERRTA